MQPCWWGFKGVFQCITKLRQSDSQILTHLSVSVADGLSKGAPSLSVLHLHWCIVGQQQVGTLCKRQGKMVRPVDYYLNYSNFI